jgi:uncharacterized protein (TIGR00251 family)
MIPLKQTDKGISFTVKVQPRARKNAITGSVGEALKLSLTAPPVEGKANQAVIEFLADFFDIPRSSVTIASGKTSRLKMVNIRGAGLDYLQQRLAALNLL